MMETIKIALMQLLPTDSRQGNLDKGLAACRQAKRMDADIALFPEMWSNGYRMVENPSALQADAIGRDDPFLTAFAELARELDMAIGMTYLERLEPAPRNSIRLFDRHGKPVLDYAKVHTCDFDVERLLTPGEQFPVAQLDLGRGQVKVGGMICYDREFPETARILMLGGAELILVANACPMEINRLSQLRARAYENMLAIATTSYPSGQPDCNGHSSAFDGIAYYGDGSGARDTLVVEAGEAEGIYIAPIAIGKIREYRRREVHGNAYRRPRLYGALVSGEVSEPFIREGRRG